MKKNKLLQKALDSPKNFRFSDAVTLVEAFGIRLSRQKGSHHIFVHQDMSELLNLQEVKGQVKPYQIAQFLQLVERYNLKIGGDD